MATKEKHIELSPTQLEIVKQSVATTNQLQQQAQVAQQMLNNQANANELLLKTICDSKGVEYSDNIKFDGKKLIIPPTK